MRPTVVAGIGGSRTDEGVIRWAAEETSRRGLDLLLILAADTWGQTERTSKKQARTNADIVQRATAVAESAGTSDARVRVVVGQSPGDAFLASTDDAELLVVSAGGGTAAGGGYLGRTAHQVATEARCTVTVVPDDWTTPAAGHRNAVAVGVSPSRPGFEALNFAFAQAEQRDVPLIAVRSRDAVAAGGYADPPDEYDWGTDGQRRLLNTLVDAVQRRHPSVVVILELSRESPPVALLSAADRAQLVVVGCRYSAEEHISRLGAVVSQVLTTATCPTVVCGQPVRLIEAPSADSRRLPPTEALRPVGP